MSNWQEKLDYEARAKVASELTRRQFWMDTYKAAVAASRRSPGALADQALKDYDERFYGHVRK